MVEAGLLLQAQDADGFQDAQCAHAVGVRRVLGAFEADGHMAHRAQVVDLVRLHLLNDADQVAAVGQVAVMQREVLLVDMRVLIQVVNTVGIERRGPALDAVDFITFAQQKLGQVSAVLPCDAGDEGNFYSCNSGRHIHYLINFYQST